MRSSNQQPHSAGADGCPGGWALAVVEAFGTIVSLQLLTTLAQVVAESAPCQLTLIDIPMGLPSAGRPHSRWCDTEARRKLGPRASTVFSPPCREALAARSYKEACLINQKILGRQLSRQSWGISAKIREVDELLLKNAQLQGRFRESHPEVCFVFLAQQLGAAPPARSKHKPEGELERREILKAHCPNLDAALAQVLAKYPVRLVAPDDWLDAVALAVLGRHVCRNSATRVRTQPEHDALGLAMEIVGTVC